MVSVRWSNSPHSMEMFPQHVISRGGDVPWTARSPDLSACGYFLWGYLKSKVFISKPKPKAKHKGRNRGDPGADDSSSDGKSWSKTEAVFEKWWYTSE